MCGGGACLGSTLDSGLDSLTEPLDAFPMRFFQEFHQEISLGSQQIVRSVIVVLLFSAVRSWMVCTLIYKHQIDIMQVRANFMPLK